MKPLLIGEANPYGADPSFALYPRPERASGHRLCTLVMGLRETEYLRNFDRVNLCPEKWSAPTSRFSAQRIMAGDHQKIVLLGAKVTGAFGFKFEPFTMIEPHAPETVPNGKTYVILPHPSGLNRMWGKPGAYDQARQILRAAGVLS